MFKIKGSWELELRINWDYFIWNVRYWKIPSFIWQVDFVNSRNRFLIFARVARVKNWTTQSSTWPAYRWSVVEVVVTVVVQQMIWLSHLPYLMSHCRRVLAMSRIFYFDLTLQVNINDLLLFLPQIKWPEVSFLVDYLIEKT